MFDYLRFEPEMLVSCYDLDPLRNPCLKCTPGRGLPPRKHPPFWPGTFDGDRARGWVWLDGTWFIPSLSYCCPDWADRKCEGSD